MVRLSDINSGTAKFLRELPLPELPETPWVDAPELEVARVAVVTTAGLHRRGDPVFRPGAFDYRIIPGDIDPANLVMSHVSVNFDRSAFQQDINAVFPIDRLRELAASGEIASVASWHYAFMGASDPMTMEQSAADVGRLLREDGVTAALLVPV